MKSRVRVRFAALVAASILAACSSSGYGTTTPPPPPPPAPPPPPPPPPVTQHLYLGQGDVPGKLLVYNLPLTSGSTPVDSLRYDADVSLSINTTTLVATRITDFSVSFFHLPLTSASTPYATIPVGLDEYPLLLPSGALYLSARDTIHIYTPPFTSSSTPSGQIVTPNFTAAMTIDPSGTVYANNATQIDVISGGALTTTLTAAPGTEFDAVAASATQLFACEGTNVASHVYIYSLPLTANATPAVTMNSGTIGISGCALDSSGNLYLTWGPTLVVFAPPFTSSSTPALTLSINGGASGIAIGP